MRYIVFAISFATTVCAAPVAYRVVNDCYAETRKEVGIVLPDGKVAVGVTCTVVPHIIVDTTVIDTTKR